MIKEFSNAEYGTVKTTLVDNQPYFCLVDIARLLGIKNVGECRTKIPSSEIKTVAVKSTNKLFISAQEITTCIFLSKKAEAELINDWLYRVVLPQLMNYSKYAVDDFKDPNHVIKFLDEYQELKTKNTILETEKQLNSGRLKYINKLLGTASCIDLDIVHQVLKFRGIGSTEIFKILRARHVLDERNQPYQQYCDKLYFRAVEAKTVAKGSVITSNRTYVYKSGITFIEKLLTEYEVTRNAQKTRKSLYAK